MEVSLSSRRRSFLALTLSLQVLRISEIVTLWTALIDGGHVIKIIRQSHFRRTTGNGEEVKFRHIVVGDVWFLGAPINNQVFKFEMLPKYRESLGIGGLCRAFPV